MCSPAVRCCGVKNVRVRRGGDSLLVARAGDGPDALREAIREAGRRGGASPFLKTSRPRRGTAETAEPDEDLAGPIAAAKNIPGKREP